MKPHAILISVALSMWAGLAAAADAPRAETTAGIVEGRNESGISVRAFDGYRYSAT